MEGGGGIQRRARQQQTFWSYQGCLVTTANYLQGRETGQYRRRGEGEWEEWEGTSGIEKET